MPSAKSMLVGLLLLVAIGAGPPIEADAQAPTPGMASITGHVLLDINGDGLASGSVGESAIVELEQGDCIKSVSTVTSDANQGGLFEFVDVPYGQYTLVIWGNQEVISVEAGGTPLQKTLRPSEGRVDVKIDVSEATAAQLQDVVILRGLSTYDAFPEEPAALQGRVIPSSERAVVGSAEPVAISPGSVVGYVIQDLEEDGICGPGDRAAAALVQLIQQSSSPDETPIVAEVVPDDSGRFEFFGAPSGDWVLSIYWMPGAIGAEAGGSGVPTTVASGSMGYRSEIAVSKSADGKVSPNDLVILVKPLPYGMAPYPPGTGAEPPVGRAQVGMTGNTMGVPSTGDGSGLNTRPAYGVLAVLGLLILIGGTALLRLQPRSK